MRRLVLPFLLCLAVPGLAVPAAGQPVFPSDRLTIETRAGASHPFRIELALSPRQKALGLMFRRQLAPDAGMLFPYDRPQILTMWMRNTYIPLDMIFADSTGRIVHIAENTIPLSTQIVSSVHPARAVLELNAGTARRLGLQPGDRLRHSTFRD